MLGYNVLVWGTMPNLQSVHERRPRSMKQWWYMCDTDTATNKISSGDEIANRELLRSAPGSYPNSLK